MKSVSDLELFIPEYKKLCYEIQQSSISSQSKGPEFEERISFLLNDLFKVSINSGQKNLKECRGINKQQFDLEFIHKDNKYWCECKYTDRYSNNKDLSDAWSKIKDGLQKFICVSFQRYEYERSFLKDYRKVYLIIFTNIRLNAPIINDCIFNNVIFLNPYQPFIPLALKLFTDKQGQFAEFNNREIYDKLSLYTDFYFDCIKNKRNTQLLDKEIAENYFSFLYNNGLEGVM